MSISLSIALVFAIAGASSGSRFAASADEPPAAQPKPDAIAAASPEDIEFFEKRVRPVLAARCYECHGANAEKRRGGLRLDSRQAVLKGGDTGPAAVPGDLEKSLLVEAIGFTSSSIEMPPSGKLPEKEIADLREWVRRGLPFPTAAETADMAKARVDLATARKHWAFRPVHAADLPTVEQLRELATTPSSEPPRERTDVLVRLAQRGKGVSPNGPASRATLIRRLSYTVRGLPASAEEVDEFVADESPDAYDRLVERFLASPRHGERWGRYWLDLARYCDVPEQWREGEAKAYLYRDWVVGAFNRDLPFDDFVRRQLAADLQPNAEPADNAALGLLGLSPTYWKELKLDQNVIKAVVADEWEERIEALGATFLGLTLACARCHDHKFDPVSMQDYYALAGVLASIKQDDTPVIPADAAKVARDARAKVKELEKELEKLRMLKPATDEIQQQIAQKQAEIGKLKSETPYFDLPPAYGVVEASLHVLPDGQHRTKLEYRPGQPQDIALHLRGNPTKPGETVPRRFLSLFSQDSTTRFQQGSGRRELAESIVGEAGALTARVYVNRVWKQVFGRGLVTQTSNFGLQTEPPSHPELLDDLAARFQAHGWSTKWLQRELLSSATYRQAGTVVAAHQAVDPDNVLLWRSAPRRLDVEAWRDTMLAVADELDLTIGGAPRELLDAGNRRRSLYGTVRRRELNDMFRLFDFPDPVSHSANREPTTTPLQQLFVLNSAYFQQRSAALAARVQADVPAPPNGTTDQVRAVYRRLFSRTPTSRELSLGAEFLDGAKSAGVPLAEAWQQYAQMLLASNELLFVD
ncbi:MAG TPA: PSD1 and planctomycete cytochrome C domain-containing protein [Pirellulaceae bacterium]|nr:PSD1 and planctomycete cytochrome C domain-containing protein [Pirellulaceae bacterium]